jgi:hypothetical protein
LPRAEVSRFFLELPSVFFSCSKYHFHTVSHVSLSFLFFFFIDSLFHKVVINFFALRKDIDRMSKKGDFEVVGKDIVKLLHQPEYDDGSAGPVLVRLAWYASHP